MSLSPREIALQVLTTLDNRHKTPDAVLDAVYSQYPYLIKRDKSLLFTLIYGVLRHKGRLDWIISQYSKTKLEKIDPKVLHVLRLGLFQMLFLDRIPVSAAVNTSVEMVKRFQAPYVARYVNGVLRNVARTHHQLKFPSVDDHPVEALSITKSFPQWMIKRWIKRFGLTETQSLLDYLNTISPITVRTNTLKTTRQDLFDILSKEVASIRLTRYAEDGISFERPDAPLFELDSFKKGWFQVQDEAAQLVTVLLDPQPGETIMDACAGLGGKTGHIAQQMKNTGKIFAIDNAAEKLVQLCQEMKRLGISAVTTEGLDLASKIDADRFPLFDRILVDAPCSGLGVLRRNPDAKWKRHPSQFKRLNDIQGRMLANVASLLKPGGVLVYAVCSLEPEENEAVVEPFLDRHPFTVENTAGPGSAMIKPMMSKNGFFKTIPHQHHMDGFFAAKLTRIK